MITGDILDALAEGTVVEMLRCGTECDQVYPFRKVLGGRWRRETDGVLFSLDQIMPFATKIRLSDLQILASLAKGDK